jgi:hypothetical protein
MTIRIIGEGLDALIFASSLTREKINFQWVVRNSRLGGYFAGAVNCVGEPIDLGMVLLEPNTYEVEQTALINFHGQFGYQARPFLNEAYESIRETLGNCLRVEVKSQLGELGVFPDYFISDRLAAFEVSSPVARQELKERIEKLGTDTQWHPSFKNETKSQLRAIGIADYFKRVYGEAIYSEFFETYLTNFLGEFVNHLPANLHRRAWLPLYWPETIHQHIQTSGNSKNLFSPIFEKPSQGSIAKWVKGMLDSVLSSPIGELISSPNVFSESFQNLESSADFFFVKKSEIPGVKNATEGYGNRVNISVRMVHYCAQIHSNEVVFLANSKNGIFRYSTSATTSNSSGGVTFEFGQNTAEISDEDVLRSALTACRELGIHPTCQGTIFPGKLPIGAEAKLENFDREVPFANYQTFHNTNSSSINDNIIRGAWAMKRISEKQI